MQTGTTSVKKISIAFSPDTDDAFMVYAMRSGQLTHPDYDIAFYSEDIQKLNASARKAEFDICAVSVAAFPDLKENYVLMPVGASVGYGYGPVLVKKQNNATAPAIEGAKIAVPGEKTTAYLAARALFGTEFEAVPMPFDEIGPAVLEGRVDYGLLIHELQLNFHEHGLEKVADLGALWLKQYNSPLPLGINVIRRSLGREHIQILTQLYLDSIRWAHARRHDTLATASAQAKAGLDPELAHRYIDMYVNDHSLDLRTEVKGAMQVLFDIGYELGIYLTKTKVVDADLTELCIQDQTVVAAEQLN